MLPFTAPRGPAWVWFVLAAMVALPGACGAPTYVFDAAAHDAGCVTCNGHCVPIASDPDNCGNCGNRCPTFANSMRICAAGVCQTPCMPGFADCDHNTANGCETSLTTPENCGGCGTRCTASAGNHVVAACVDAQCTSACAPGFGNCNGTLDDGCETVVDSVSSCGSCDTVCSTPANATARCEALACTFACDVMLPDTNFADCNHNAADGCEINLNSPGNCGSCGHSCAGGQVCSAGMCAGSCATTETNCGGGCVNPSTNAANCGSCGTVCPARPNARAVCSMATCTIGCNSGYGDCDANEINGCESVLNTPTHCGSCANTCTAVANAAPACAGGACIPSCAAGYADCNHTYADGCEINVTNDVANCSMCGLACAPRANASVGCANRACTMTCSSGYADCNASPADGCETPLGTTSNCAGCGNACPVVANATATCSGATCGFMCQSGYGNCDSNGGNGCETNLNTSVSNCGACGTVCSFANAAASCVSRACAMGACNAGFANCDSNPANGCETSLGTNSNCAGCGNVCPGTQTCSSGACRCPAGTTACGTSCFNVSVDVTNCGSCGHVCSLANATAGCTGGVCTVAACVGGWGNCDGVASNGCELNLTGDVSNCGTCGHVCSVANGTPNCTSGACGVASCMAGYYASGGSCIPVDPPRLITPMSTSVVTSPTPTLQVQRVPGVPATWIDICGASDPTCTAPIQVLRGSGVDLFNPTALLPGMYYWRARGASLGVAGSTYSPTWQFRVPRGATTAGPDTFADTELDWRRLGVTAGLVGASTAGTTGAGQMIIYRWNGSAMASVNTIDAPAGTGFGVRVANAGDVNGDGLGDILVGNCLGGTPPTGLCDRVFVFRGNAGGGPTLLQTLSAPTGVSGFGYGLGAGGDLDGDGYGDIVVGAYGSDVAFVWFGGASGFGAAPDVTLSLPACTASLATCTGTAPMFGVSVIGATDFNGDRLADIALGAPIGWNRVYVFAGGTRAGLAGRVTELAPTLASTRNFGLSVGATDVNNDGRSDLIVGGNANGGVAAVYLGGGGGTPIFLNNPAVGTGAFGVAVAGAGDTNGDGFGDVIVGAPGATTGAAAAVYIYRGGSTGINVNPSQTISGTGALGRFVTGPGDFDNDGFGDVSIAACFTPAGATCNNAARFCRGSTTGLNVAGCQDVTGTGNFGISVASFRPLPIRTLEPTAALLLSL